VSRTAFDGAVVVIAGGASGIGRAMAYQLAEQGAQVVVSNRAGQSLESFRREPRPAGPRFTTYATDWTAPDEVERLVRQVVGQFGRIDYLFITVGMVQGGEVKDTPLEVIQDVVHTNIDAATIGTHYVYPRMVEQGSGHLVLFASAAGLLPTPLMAFYTLSKYGLVGFAHALRAEGRDLGVKVSVVCPAFVKTPIYEKAHYTNLDKAKTIDVLFNRLPIQSPEAAAGRILRGVARNQATIHTWFSAHAAWWLYRLSPSLYLWLAGRAARVARKRLELKQP
jgi:short-subunit dehydrogenase